MNTVILPMQNLSFFSSLEKDASSAGSAMASGAEAAGKFAYDNRSSIEAAGKFAYDNRSEIEAGAKMASSMMGLQNLNFFKSLEHDASKAGHAMATGAEDAGKFAYKHRSQIEQGAQFAYDHRQQIEDGAKMAESMMGLQNLNFWKSLKKDASAAGHDMATGAEDAGKFAYKHRKQIEQGAQFAYDHRQQIEDGAKMAESMMGLQNLNFFKSLEHDASKAGSAMAHGAEDAGKFAYAHRSQIEQGAQFAYDHRQQIEDGAKMAESMMGLQNLGWMSSLENDASSAGSALASGAEAAGKLAYDNRSSIEAAGKFAYDNRATIEAGAEAASAMIALQNLGFFKSLEHDASDAGKFVGKHKAAFETAGVIAAHAAPFVLMAA